MKKLVKILMIAFITGSVLNSCETTELDLTVSPNALSPNQADPNLLLNSIQFGYRNNMTTFNNLGSQLTRIDYMFGRNYFNNFSSATMSGVWSTTYSNLFLNTQAIIDINNSEVGNGNFNFHVGIGQAMKAHSLLLLVDYIGEAALSQAGNPAEFPAPLLDDGPSVYAGALALLDEAESLLSSGPATNGATDFYYAGDTAKWIRFINTVRLKAAITTGDSATFNSLIAADNYISDTADDMQFTYGTRELQPDTRHPSYAGDYTPTGAGGYESNWLMNNMLQRNDPRLRYYFYRQEDATPGADAPEDEETLACSLAVPPAHYAGFIYCSIEQGYWGRSHGNDEGIPPDGFLKVASGVYPAGGRFDDNSFANVGLGLGGGGAGVEPILLASYVDFWRGQNAIATGGDAAPFLQAGMEKSIAKAASFIALDGNADGSVAPTAMDVSDYVTATIADFNAATGDDKENIFAEQYWIALYGGGAEAYNYYRRTGFPTTLSPNWELDPGPFPRTFLYPQNEVTTNANLTQRADLTTQVFWDTNPASPTFPPAN